MKNIKERTIYYRRVAWGAKHKPLEQFLLDAHNNLDTTASRTFSHGEGEILGISWSRSPGSKGGMLFQVAEYIPHQATSLVPFPSRAIKKDKTTAFPPPAQKNYMSGDIFCLLRGDDLLLCPSGARESVADRATCNADSRGSWCQCHKS